MARGISYRKHNGIVTIWFGRWAVHFGDRVKRNGWGHSVEHFLGGLMTGDLWAFGPLGSVTRVRDPR